MGKIIKDGVEYDFGSDIIYHLISSGDSGDSSEGESGVYTKQHLTAYTVDWTNTTNGTSVDIVKTYDCTSMDGYENLTVDNFNVELNYQAGSNKGAVSSINKQYENGILTITFTVWSMNGGSSATYDLYVVTSIEKAGGDLTFIENVTCSMVWVDTHHHRLSITDEYKKYDKLMITFPAPTSYASGFKVYGNTNEEISHTITDITPTSLNYPDTVIYAITLTDFTGFEYVDFVSTGYGGGNMDVGVFGLTGESGDGAPVTAYLSDVPLFESWGVDSGASAIYFDISSFSTLTYNCTEAVALRPVVLSKDLTWTNLLKIGAETGEHEVDITDYPYLAIDYAIGASGVPQFSKFVFDEDNVNVDINNSINYGDFESFAKFVNNCDTTFSTFANIYIDDFSKVKSFTYEVTATNYASYIRYANDSGATTNIFGDNYTAHTGVQANQQVTITKTVNCEEFNFDVGYPVYWYLGSSTNITNLKITSYEMIDGYTYPEAGGIGGNTTPTVQLPSGVTLTSNAAYRGNTSCSTYFIKGIEQAIFSTSCVNEEEKYKGQLASATSTITIKNASGTAIHTQNITTNTNTTFTFDWDAYGCDIIFVTLSIADAQVTYYTSSVSIATV